MSFDAHEYKIRKIFSGETRFTIPRNQRKYVWDEKQWKELLGDIQYIYNRKTNEKELEINHFLGSFVLQENNNNYEIIDGQQRITTLLLILSSLCVLFNEFLDKEEHGITKQNLIGNVGLKSQYIRMDNPNIKNLQVIIQSVSVYRDNLNGEKLFDSLLLDKNERSNKNVLRCFYFYYNYWKDNINNLEELVLIRDTVLDMRVIHISSEDELDCYDIFEILNARGVDLEESELLKNYIFKYAQPEYTIDRAKEIWTTIEKNLDECNGNMEQFLSHFVTYKYKKPDKSEGVFRTIKSNTDKNKVNELLDSLYEASKRYIWFYKPEQCSNVEMAKSFEYFKMVNHRQFRPLFLAVLEVYGDIEANVVEQNKIFTYLKNFSFAYTLVMGQTSNLIENKVYALSQELLKNKDYDVFNEVKKVFQVFYPKYEEFERAFLNLGFSNKNPLYKNSNNRRRAFYILKEMEEYKQHTHELNCNTSNCNIEHIMCDEDNNLKVCQLGNLLILSSSINENMGNKSFEEKIKKLSSSKLMVVKDFVSNYGGEKEWTCAKIEQRTKKISELAYNQIWKIER